MNATEACVNISIIYFLLVINTIIDMITARKQKLQSMHFNVEHFSYIPSNEGQTFIYIEKKIKGLKRSTLTAATTDYFQWGKR